MANQNTENSVRLSFFCGNFRGLYSYFDAA